MAYIDIVINRGIKVLENAEFRAVGRTMSSRASTIFDFIKDHIGDAEERQLHEPDVKKWMERIKYLSYDLVDLWEELNLKKELAKKNTAASCLVVPCYSLDSIRGFEMELERIVGGFAAIAIDASKLGLHRGREPSIAREIMESAPLPKRTSLSDEEHINFHGRDRETRTLIRKLLRHGILVDLMARSENVVFIAIVGEDGIGKTALAQHVFNDPEVRHHFNHWAWVSVSGEFNLKQIVKDIIRSLTSAPVRDVEMEALELRFRQVIEGKTLLLVLDDVRNDDCLSWQGLSSFLKPCQFGSMVLLTTPAKAVALTAGTGLTNLIHLKGLSERAWWSIIKDTAFGHESKIEGLFNDVGRDAARKWHGVPLAARVIGSYFKVIKPEDWPIIFRSAVWNLPGGDFLRAASMLNYSLLPPVLKQCLSYCSIFPKFYFIEVDKLIKLWMAQGFVDSDQDEMESEGWRLANRLLDLNIFQEFKREGNCNLKCKVEDGMWDFIQSLKQNECHLMRVDYEKDMKEEVGENHAPEQRRHCNLLIVDQTPFSEKIEYANKLHTLMILSEDSNVDTTDLARLLHHMRRVRALDLSSCSINPLPPEVGKLLHLRYLDLSFSHDLKKLPEAICNLLNLQTLNLNGCDSLRKLPKGIGKLIKLRHLEILWTTSLSYLPKGIASLTSLRTLNRFFGSSGAVSIACNLGDLENLNYLQGCITIDGLGGETDVREAARAGLEKKNLLGLELWFSIVGSEIKDQEILEALKAPDQLQCLGIFCYRGRSFPQWMTKLDKLTHLLLADCSECDTLPLLGRLPLLKSLEIKNLAKVKQVDSQFLVTGTESESLKVAFPELENLCFQKLENWETWLDRIGDPRPHMPKLAFLSIESCPKLKALPNYITSRTGWNIDKPLKEKKIWKEDNKGVQKR